jgi:hypothetical protein
MDLPKANGPIWVDPSLFENLIETKTDFATRLLAAENNINTNSQNMTTHSQNLNNPHGVSAAQVGAYSKTESDNNYYSKTVSDNKYVKGNGKTVQIGKTDTLTCPPAQSFGFDFPFPTAYDSGITPIVTCTMNGNIANCKDLKLNVTSITNTGFRIELYNAGSVDEYAFFNWIAIG